MKSFFITKPQTTYSRHPLRPLFRSLARWACRVLLRLTVSGVENVPLTGGALLTMNHLGDADPVMLVGYTPREVEAIGKAEILSWPLLGALAAAYGMMAVRRGQPDRETLTMALEALRRGEALMLAPEGRESKTHALEQAKGGAAFLALYSGVPIVPVAITGTERVYSQWLRLRRPRVTLTFGAAYRLPPGADRRAAADLMMRRIAEMLPTEYRGVYQ